MNLLFTIKTIDYKKILNYLIIAFSFCMPISKAATSGIEILLILIWIIEGNLKNKVYLLRKNSFILIVFVFVSYSILSILWSSDTLFAIDYVKKYWHFLIIPIIYTSLLRKNIEYVFSAFLAGMLISEIVSYGIFFEFWTKSGVSSDDPSPFMDHTNYSIYLALTAFILMHRVFFSMDIRLKILYSIYCLFVVSNLFINGGRTGQFAFFICLFLVGFLNIRNKIKAFLLMLLFSVALLFLGYTYSPVFKQRMLYTANDLTRMVNSENFTGALSARIGLWITGTEAFVSEPFIGTGIGDERINAHDNIDRYKLYSFFHARTKNYIDFHNAFIQYTVQLGILGFFLFSTIFFIFFKQKFKSLVYKNLNSTFVSLFILLSFVGSSFHLFASMVLFSLFGGLFSAISRLESEQ